MRSIESKLSELHLEQNRYNSNHNEITKSNKRNLKRSIIHNTGDDQDEKLVFSHRKPRRERSASSLKDMESFDFKSAIQQNHVCISPRFKKDIATDQCYTHEEEDMSSTCSISLSSVDGDVNSEVLFFRRNKF